MSDTPSPANRPLAIALTSVAIIGGLAWLLPRLSSVPEDGTRDESIGSVREVYAGTLLPDIQARTFRNIDKLFPSRTVAAGSSKRRAISALDRPS